MINTKMLMTVSALVMGLAGIALTFAPEEILAYIDPHDTAMDRIMLQIMGALYFAFAMINWTAKANLIGGIYSRPIAIGNFTHFAIGALALFKSYSSLDDTLMLIPLIVYSVFAVSFGIVFFTHPVQRET